MIWGFVFISYFATFLDFLQCAGIAFKPTTSFQASHGGSCLYPSIQETGVTSLKQPGIHGKSQARLGYIQNKHADTCLKATHGFHITSQHKCLHLLWNVCTWWFQQHSELTSNLENSKFGRNFEKKKLFPEPPRNTNQQMLPGPSCDTVGCWHTSSGAS